jgi:uncharacterized protein HemX
MSRKLPLAVGGVLLGLFAVWAVIQLASSGYAFGQFLADRDTAKPAAEAPAAKAADASTDDAPAPQP